MLQHEKLPSTNSTKSDAHYNFAKFQENKHTPECLFSSTGAGLISIVILLLLKRETYGLNLIYNDLG